MTTLLEALPARATTWCTGTVQSRIWENEAFGAFVTASAQRHFADDWGDIEGDGVAANEAARESKARIFSVYDLPADMVDLAPAECYRPCLWVITDEGWGNTTILFPSDY